MQSVARNPGGSLGSGDFPVSIESNSLDEIKQFLFEHNGYEVSNNLFSQSYIAGKNVVEVGCGHGFMTLILSQIAATVDGYDVDVDAIEYAEKLRSTLKLGNIRFSAFEGEKVLAGDNQYDCAVSCDVIEHVPNPLAYLREINRILKKNGILVLSTPNGLIANKNKCIIQSHSKFHLTEFLPSEISSLIANSGFVLSDSFVNINIIGKGYRIGFLKKTIMRILCRTHLLSLASALNLKVHRKKQVLTERNRVTDYRINRMPLSSISQKNCDAIIMVAIKH